MWESRVSCEISKSLWKPFCGFHRDVISTAIFDVALIEPTGGLPYPCRLVDRRSFSETASVVNPRPSFVFLSLPVFSNTPRISN